MNTTKVINSELFGLIDDYKTAVVVDDRARADLAKATATFNTTKAKVLDIREKLHKIAQKWEQDLYVLTSSGEVIVISCGEQANIKAVLPIKQG